MSRATSRGAPRVEYRSRGTLLLFGDAESVTLAAGRLPGGLRGLVVVEDAGTEPPLEGFERVPGRLSRIEGHLGCYRAWAAGAPEELDLGPLSPNGDGLFDLILDLGTRPLLDREILPPGYLATRGSTERLEALLETVAALVGPVYKPRYFDYDEARCAHHRQGVAGCSRCLDACPAQAIEAVDDGIAVDPYLCQGCGSCTLACPSGALSYAEPTRRETLDEIARLLSGGEAAPTLLLHEAAELPPLPPQVRPLRLPRIGSVGMEVWFRALALGAGRVILLLPDPLPLTTGRHLAEQVELARRLLRGLGEAEERIRMSRDLGGIDWEGLTPACPPLPLAGDDGRGKRETLLCALDQIGRGGGAPAPFPLPRDAPLGTLRILADDCTRCLACVQICPVGALQRGEGGGLAFTEGRCLQCGLCAHACPEEVIALRPRWQPDPALRDRPRELVAPDEPYRCTQCGSPFAPRRLVEAGMANVRHNPMFQGEGLELLTLCMSCRQKAMIGRPGVQLIDEVP